MDPEMDGWFEVEARTNYAEAAIEQWRKDNPNPDPGVVLTVVNTRNTATDD